MSTPDEQPTPQKPSLPEETPPAENAYPEPPVPPQDFTPLDRTGRQARARRRRARRMLVPSGADERAVLLDGLARRAFPSFEFFLFAFFAGIVLGAAYLLDSPALLLLGILLAPLLTPWMGMTLAIMTGSWRFFFLTLCGLLVASLLVLLTGALAGLAGHLWMPLPLFHANIHARLWWPDLFIVALGAILLTISFVRSEQKPVLPSILLAYGLFLPISAGGVGLGMGITQTRLSSVQACFAHLGSGFTLKWLGGGLDCLAALGKAPIWPDGVLVFFVHLALATLVGGITLAALHFKPVKIAGYLLPFLLGLVCLGTLVYLTGLTNLIRSEIVATRHVAPTPTATPVPPSLTPTLTDTPIPSSTITLTSTTTVTMTPEPTPSYAVITSPSGGGALVYSEPGAGAVLQPLSNGIIVQVMDEIQTAADGRNWIHIRWNDVDGWVLTTVLTATTSTPEPPMATLTPTP